MMSPSHQWTWMVAGAQVLLATLGCGSSGSSRAPHDAAGANHDLGILEADAGRIGPGDAGDSGVAAGPPVIIVVTPGDLTLAPAGATALHAEARDASGTVLALDLTWHSSNESIATVDGGLATGMAAGDAQITAAGGGLTSSPATVHVVVGSSTNDLLAKAVASNEITADQALAYEVLAMFGDPNLPAKYRGTSTGRSLQNDLLMVEAASRFDALTADQQAAIGPYFVPPAYVTGSSAPATAASYPPGTYPDVQTDRPGFCSGLGVLKSDWTNVSTANFRIWWNSKTLSEAASFVDDIGQAAESAYKHYTDDLLLNPFLDDTKLPPGSQDLPPWLCNGGDGRLDIYILDSTAALPGLNGATIPVDAGWSSGGLSSAFILLSPQAIIGDPSPATTKVLRGTVAHELMHAVQLAYLNLGNASHTWSIEATATWAQDSAFPTEQSEVPYGWPFLTRMNQPLFYPNQACLGSDQSPDCAMDPGADLKMYGAYLFFLWATHTFGDSVVSTFYDGPTDDSLASLENALGEPLSKAWNDFVVAAWNGGEVPETTVLQTWNKTVATPEPTNETLILSDPVGPAVTVTAPTRLAPGDTLSKDVHVNELSVVYDRYTIDPEVRSLIFYNGFTQKMSSIPVQAYAPVGPTTHTVTQSVGSQVFAYATAAGDQAGRHLWALKNTEDPASPNGKWTQEDWTDQPFVTLCRDKASERVDELVLIFSNGASTTARKSDFAANAVAAIGDQAAVLVASPVPCWEYQGTFNTSFDYQDAMDSFSISSALSATFVAKPFVESSTNAQGVAQKVLRAWEFAADPMTIAITSKLTQACGADDMKQAGAEFFSGGIPGFDSVLPYPPIDAAYGAIFNSQLYSRNYVQWPIQKCDGTAAVTPAIDPLNLDLHFTSWLPIDLPDGLFVSPPDGAKSPVASAGSFPGAGEVTNTWNMTALREGDPVPAGSP